MKHIVFNKLALILLGLFILGSCCKDVITGTYLIHDDYRKYIVSDSFATFNMVENNGISEGFFSKPYISVHQWSADSKCGEGYSTEYFQMTFQSTINRFIFDYKISGDWDGTSLQLEWNQKDRVNYNFIDKTFQTEITPFVNIIDSVLVNNYYYSDVILVNYSSVLSQISSTTPLKIYLAPTIGLIKFETQQGIIFERN
jgi:hypothetical protein